MKKQKVWCSVCIVLTMVLMTGCGSNAMDSVVTDSTGYYDGSAMYSNSASSPMENYALQEEAGIDSDSAYWGDDVTTEEFESQDGGTGEYDVSQFAQDTGRKLITTMNISAETEEFDALLRDVENKVAELNGYIESMQVGYQYTYYNDSDANMQYAYLTARIPAQNLNSFVGMVEGAAHIIDRSQYVTDVTLSYVDTESRKEALQVEYDSVLALMERAELIEDIITLESRLSDLRYQLDSLESQLRTYDNRVNYSTVTIRIDEVIRLTPVITKELTVWDKIDTGVQENLYRLKQWSVNLFIGIAVASPFIAVWGGIVLILLVITLFVTRKQRKLRKEWKKQRVEQDKSNELKQKEEQE